MSKPNNFNVQYADSDGKIYHYLGINTDEVSAKRWCDEFNKRYRKPFPNMKGYYAAAIVVDVAKGD